MMLAVPGAIAGGVFFQWLFGFKFSVTVWVGYIACFGMATSTGIIMLVYLREAVDEAGGLARDDAAAAPPGRARWRGAPAPAEAPDRGRRCIIGLAPMLWAGGVGAEVIRPMAAPVLGGILVADEVDRPAPARRVLRRPPPTARAARGRPIGRGARSDQWSGPSSTHMRIQ